MKGDAKVIAALNEVLVGELTAINQYFLHGRMCRTWGYQKLAAKLRDESIEEMKHASDLADRVLFLEGIPNFQKLGKLHIGENVLEQLESDLKLENEALPLLRKGIEACEAVSDHISRDLFETILKAEEGHIEWIESQLRVIKEIGYQNYLTQQL